MAVQSVHEDVNSEQRLICCTCCLCVLGASVGEYGEIRSGRYVTILEVQYTRLGHTHYIPYMREYKHGMLLMYAAATMIENSLSNLHARWL